MADLTGDLIPVGYLGASFVTGGKPAESIRLLAALDHAVRKNHPLSPSICAGCLDICNWLTVPGYRGESHGPC